MRVQGGPLFLQRGGWIASSILVERPSVILERIQHSTAPTSDNRQSNVQTRTFRNTTHSAATSGCVCLSSSLMPPAAAAASTQANLPFKMTPTPGAVYPGGNEERAPLSVSGFSLWFFRATPCLFEVLILLFSLYLAIRGPSSPALHTSGRTAGVPGERFSWHCPGFFSLIYSQRKPAPLCSEIEKWNPFLKRATEKHLKGICYMGCFSPFIIAQW